MANDTETLTVQLTVTAAQGAPRVPLTVVKSITPTDLRKQASEATKIPLASLKLIFRGRLIGDDDTKQAVAEFKVEDGSVIHCMGKPEKDGATAPASVPAAVAPPTTTSMPTVSLQPSMAVPQGMPPAASTAADPLQAALQMLRASNPPADYQTAVTTLQKLLNKIIEKPMEEKYRRVKKNNAAFQGRLGGLTGGDAAMKAAGFEIAVEDGEEVYLLRASSEAWPKLVAAVQALEAVVRDAQSAASSQPVVPPPIQPGGAMPAGMMNSFGNPGMGGGGQDMQNAASMLSDPNALQSMMQNPAVQQMMRNDPRFANNPMLQQSVQQIANDPAMAAQMSQLMRDPNAMRQMQAMMQQGGGMAMPPMGGFGNGAGVAGSNAQQQQQQGANNQGQASSGVSDEQMTEEEMIAEAIRRSLQEDG